MLTLPVEKGAFLRPRSLAFILLVALWLLFPSGDLVEMILDVARSLYTIAGAVTALVWFMWRGRARREETAFPQGVIEDVTLTAPSTMMMIVDGDDEHG